MLELAGKTQRRRLAKQQAGNRATLGSHGRAPTHKSISRPRRLQVGEPTLRPKRPIAQESPGHEKFTALIFKHPSARAPGGESLISKRPIKHLGDKRCQRRADHLFMLRCDWRCRRWIFRPR